MSSKKAITVQLVGGLGNQLFGYFAGRYVANKLGVPLQLDMSQFDKGITAHGSDIRSFSLAEDIVHIQQETRFPVLVVQNAMNLLANKMPATRTLVEKFMGIHTSVPIGVDPRIHTMAPGMLMRGYYQTFRYVWEVSQAAGYKQFELTEPSAWYRDLSQRALEIRPIMVHVRRGDYAKPANVGFGMLSADYYKAAVEILRAKLGGEVPVWVFSDELSLVRQELAGVIGGEVEYVDPPLGTDAAESMMLMAIGRANVISNSTFSWWAAILNPAAPVVAPTAWFKEMPQPEDLIPGSWLRQESIWK